MTILHLPEPTIAELRAINEQLLLAGLREQAAREDAERLTAGYVALLSQATDGVLIIDPTGRITYVNAAAHQLDRTLHVGLSIGTSISGPIESGVPRAVGRMT